METDPAVIAFNEQTAQIAAEVTAQLEGSPAPQGVATPAPAPAPTPTPAADPVVEKLLAKLTDLEAKFAAVQTPAADPAPAQDSWTDFHDDPWAAMEKRGIDVSHVARSIVARVMGNDAPPELKAQAAVGGRMAQLQTQVSDLMGQVKSLSSELGKRDYYSQIEAHTPAADSTPATSAMLKANPQWVKETVRQIVAEDARARSTVPGAKPLTPAEVYQRVEARIAPVYSAFSQPQTSTAATPVPGSVTPTAPVTPPAFAGALNGTTPPAPSATTWDEKVANVMQDVLTKYNLK